jgi:putative endonuclease
MPGPDWWLYIVECSDGRLYTGIAIDPQARFELHSSGKGAAFTRINGAKALLACQPFEDRSSAARAEYRLKRRSREEKLEWIAKWSAEAKSASTSATASDTRIPA